MNKYYNWILSLVLIVGGCCKADLEPANIIPNEREAVRFTGNVVNVTPVKTIYGFFQPGDSIGIYMINADSALSALSILDNVNNYLYKSLSLSSSPEFVPVNADTIFYPTPTVPSFIAYYPGRSVVQNFLLPINLSSQPTTTSIVDLDMLYSNNAIKQTSLAVNLQFNHILSYLNVEINAGNGLAAADLDGITVVFKNIATKANFNLVTATFQDITSPTDTILLPGKYYPVNQAGEFEALIIPGGNNSNTQIEFNLANNKKFVYQLPADQVFESGYFYNYIFTLSSSSAIITATINSWKIGSLPNGGVIEVQ